MQETCVAEKLMAEFNGERISYVFGRETLLSRDSLRLPDFLEIFLATCGLFYVDNELRGVWLQGNRVEIP